VQLEIEKQVHRASFLPTLHFKISNLEFIKENKDPVIFQVQNAQHALVTTFY